MRVRSQGNKRFSRRLLLCSVGFVSFIVLGLLGMHLDGADAIKHQLVNSTTSASMIEAATVQTASETVDLVISSSQDAPKQTLDGFAHLDFATACILAFLVTLTLVGYSLRRTHEFSLSAGRWLQLWRPSVGVKLRRPSLIMLSISRT